MSRVKSLHFRTSSQKSIGKGKSQTGDLSMSTAVERQSLAVIGTWVDFDPVVTGEVSAALTNLLADVFAPDPKPNTFHLHMPGRHSRDYHLMRDEHADQIFAMTDPIAERVRKIGGQTIESIGDVARRQRPTGSCGVG